MTSPLTIHHVQQRKLAAVMDAAKPIDRRCRDAFLQAVAAELGRYPELRSK